ncbi:MAG TPA: HupE/UreJ family protein, partial [Acidobacteriaceae bacterium]
KVQIAQQSRNENQSFYQLDFVQDPAGPRLNRFPGFSGFAGAYRLGLHHIAEGTDHLLFLLVLLLPAPLLALRGRWSRPASVRNSLVHILGIVTAFSLGHSLTLALAAFGILQLPSRPVELLIAVSILISALHAIRPMFPGREAAIAAFFGLIHGLAFASALNDLGVSSWYRLISLLGFNLGIESMQLAVVAAVLPSLIVLSRSPVYGVVRIAGALLAGVAAGAWIIQRSFETPNPIDELVTKVAHHGPLIAFCLFLLGLGSLLPRAAEALGLRLSATPNKAA